LNIYIATNQPADQTES